MSFNSTFRRRSESLLPALGEKRGLPDQAEVDSFLAAGFNSQHVLGIVQAIACKTCSNYVNHLAGTEVDAAFADYKVAE